MQFSSLLKFERHLRSHLFFSDRIMTVCANLCCIRSRSISGASSGLSTSPLSSPRVSHPSALSSVCLGLSQITLSHSLCRLSPDGTVSVCGMWMDGKLIDIAASVYVRHAEKQCIPFSIQQYYTSKMLPFTRAGVSNRNIQSFNWYTNVCVLFGNSTKKHLNYNTSL